MPLKTSVLGGVLLGRMETALGIRSLWKGGRGTCGRGYLDFRSEEGAMVYAGYRPITTMAWLRGQAIGC